MDTANQVMDSIRKALEMRKPSKPKILKYLFNLKDNNTLSDFDLFDIIGKTFELNKKFFMLSIYSKIRGKFKKIYGEERVRIMDKYILEKYCLYEEEHILYELIGTIRQIFRSNKKYNCSVRDGTIFFTNYRIIAQGKIKFSMSRSDFYRILLVSSLYALPYPAKRKREKDAYIDHSSSCYGYRFPIKTSPPLTKDNRIISYYSKISESRITIIPSEKGDHINKLYAILTSKTSEDKSNSAEKKQKVNDSKKNGEEVDDIYIKQIQDLIDEGIKFKSEKLFESALKSLNDARTLYNNLNIPSKKESILKELIEKKIEIYNEIVKENIELGKQLQVQNKFEESNQKFKTALNLVEEKFNCSPPSISSNFEKLNEIREIKNLINQNESRKINTS